MVKSIHAAIITIFIGTFSFADTLLNVDFETDGSGYTASATEGTGYTDVFNRTNPDLGGNDTYMWSFEDLSIEDPTLTLNQIDVSGQNSFSFSLDLLAHHYNDWDGGSSGDNIKIYYSLDGGDWQNLMWVLALEGESGAEANEPAALDTDFDGIAECDHVLPSLTMGTGELGCEVTVNTFQTFSTSDIALSGASTLDIKLEFLNFTSSDEGGYIDNIVVSGMSSGGDPDCTSDDDCPNANDCTSGSCIEGACVDTYADAGTVCDDGDAGTENDVCDDLGSCSGTALPTCDDGIQNQDETDVDCGGTTCSACPTTYTYDWSNGATVLGTYTNSTAELATVNNDGVLELTENPLSSTPQAFVAAVSDLNGGETIAVCVDMLSQEIAGTNDDIRGRLWGHYFDGDDPTAYDGSASGSNSYGDTPGVWKTECHTWTVADGRTGFTLEIRVYSDDGSLTLGVDNLSVSVSSGTVSFPELPATCEDENACNTGSEGDCEYVNVGWGNLQWPYSTNVDAGSDSEDIYGRVYVDGVTGGGSSDSGVVAELGYGADGSTPDDTWMWGAASANGNVDGNNDEVSAKLNIADAGTYSYSYRYKYGSSCWYYAAEIGTATVNSTTACDAATDCNGNGTTDDADNTDGCDCTCTDGFSGDDCSIAPQPDNLFFSEYGEGSGYNKYLEVYNASNDAVDLSKYQRVNCSNGCTEWEYYTPFSEGASIAAGDVYVLCDSGVDPEFPSSQCDEVGALYFNGDDAQGIFHTASSTTIDVIGAIGDDPGSGWAVGDDTNGTKDQSLVRKSTVTTGNADWAVSAGTNADDSEWVVLAQNTWEYIGSHPHEINPCSDENACNNGEIADCTYPDSGYNCDGNAIVNVTFQVNMEEQEVDGLQLYLSNPYGYHDMSDDDGDDTWSVTLVLEVGSNIEYKFKNGDNWEFDNWENGLDCLVLNGNYWNRSATVSDSDMTLDPVCFNSCENCGPDCLLGDANGDTSVDVMDIILMVDYILSETTDFEMECVDVNGDGSLDISDLVSTVAIILGRTNHSDASSAKLIQSSNGLSFKANGHVSGFQMTLQHDVNFSMELNESAWIADYKTNGNSTNLVILEPMENELFTCNGQFEITELIVANSQGAIDAMIVNEYSISNAYPNPFNPTTTMELVMPLSGEMNVEVYNLLGQSIATLASGYMDAGTYNLTWDASNAASGMYLLRAEYDGNVSMQKLMFLK